MLNLTWVYTGVVYGIAVALARRGGIDLPRRVALLFFALVVVFMFLPMTQDYVNIHTDFLNILPPWNSLDDSEPVNRQLNDVPLQIVPWAHQVRESWSSLHPPLWNSRAAAGYPLLASAQASAFSPFRLLGLPLSLGHAMTFEAGMKLLVALTCMFLFCRRRGYSELAGVFAACAFGFSTFLITWLHFPLASSACLVPAVFYVLDLLLEKLTWGRFAGGSIVWAFLLFGGHPETAAHTAFFALLYALWRLFGERPAPEGEARSASVTKDPPLRVLFMLALCLACGALLAAPLLVPFAEAVPKSKRIGDLRATPLSEEVPFSDWPSARLLIQPHFYGEVPYSLGWGPSHAEAISGFAGTLAIAAWFAMLVHVVRRRSWRTPETFFLFLVFFAVGVVAAWPVISNIFHLIFPVAANARLRLFIVFGLSLLAAACVDRMQSDRPSMLIGFGAAGALLAYTFFGTVFPTYEAQAQASSAMLPNAGVLLLAFAAAASMARRRQLLLMLLLVATIGELWEVGRDWNAPIRAATMYPRTPVIEALDSAASGVPENEPFRIVGQGASLFPNSAAIYGYEDIRQHDPMANGTYIDLLTKTTKYDRFNYFATWDEFEPRIVDFLNVRYVVTSPGVELPPRYRMLHDGSDGRLFENTEVLPRFYAVRNIILEFRNDHFDRQLRTMEDWSNTALLENLELEQESQRNDFFAPRPANAPRAEAKILEASDTHYRVSVKAPRWSLIASSVPWWPGWKVERNGVRIEPVRINGAFLAFSVPPGEADVKIWYAPWTFRAGVLVSLATMLTFVALWSLRSSARLSALGSQSDAGG